MSSSRRPIFGLLPEEETPGWIIPSDGSHEPSGATNSSNMLPGLGFAFMVKRVRGTIDRARLDAMVREATVDCYDESEQATGLFTMIEEHLDIPFETSVLGVTVKVARVDITDDDLIVAICVRGKTRQAIPILDLPLPEPAPKGVEWIAAYRHWSGGG